MQSYHAWCTWLRMQWAVSSLYSATSPQGLTSAADVPWLLLPRLCHCWCTPSLWCLKPGPYISPWLRALQHLSLPAINTTHPPSSSSEANHRASMASKWSIDLKNVFPARCGFGSSFLVPAIHLWVQYCYTVTVEGLYRAQSMWRPEELQDSRRSSYIPVIPLNQCPITDVQASLFTSPLIAIVPCCYILAVSL